MEVLIVIAIILILTSAVGFMAFRYVEKARHVTAKNQIETLSLALNAYALDCTRYPTGEQGLDALWVKPVLEPLPEGWNGPYVNKKISTDPWGHTYEYSVPGPHNLPFGIRSQGNDKAITSWED